MGELLGWENIFKFFVMIIFLFCMSLVTTYTFSKKTFEGYYAGRYYGEYRIYINWDNAPDEVAYATLDPRDQLEAMERLRGSDAPQPD